MARRVFFHVGGLKTGTTYLQRVMWKNREVLREAGVLIPGKEYRDRVWASHTVRDGRHEDDRANQSWDIIVEQVREFPGDAIISHEFFGAASAEQATRAMDALRPAEFHVVYTIRDYVRLVPTLWQEVVKHRYSGRLEDFEPQPLSASPAAVFGWRGIDVVDALDRWGADLPPSRVHVVTVPPAGTDPEILWKRFARACDFDPGVADLDLPPVNESLGASGVELLRRVNGRLGDRITAPGEPAHWIRTYLAHGVIASFPAERFGLSAERAKEVHERSVAAIETLRERDYDIVGDLEDLRGDPHRSFPGDPDTTSDKELLDLATGVIAQMLCDYREVSLERKRVGRQLRQSRRRVHELDRQLEESRARGVGTRAGRLATGAFRRVTRRVLGRR